MLRSRRRAQRSAGKMRRRDWEASAISAGTHLCGQRNGLVGLRSFGSLPLTGFVIARVSRADEGVRTGLNGGRKFSEVLSDLTHVTEELIDIFRIDVEGLVQARSDVGHRG